MGDLSVKSVTLTLTQQCNLNCNYCYEHYKSKQVLDFDEAKRIIDYEFQRNNDIDTLEFDLFGGEPFLEFDLLKKITEYICEKDSSSDRVVFATTNGTLVHGEVQEWLRKHTHCFVCGLSLDGTRDMHNINRSNSYDDIDLDFFLELYPDQDIKMTVSKKTLPNLAEGVIELHQKGFLVSCNLAYGIDWSAPENIEVLNRELHKLIDFYLENQNIEPCSMLGMEIYNVGSYPDKIVRYCGAGKYMQSYDVDGRSYPCQFFMPLSIGEEKATAANSIQLPDEFLLNDLLDEKCRSCIIRSICPNCFGSNYASTGSIYKRDDSMCRLTKIILKARSYFRAKQWACGQLHVSPDEEQALLRAIVKIQEDLEV